MDHVPLVTDQIGVGYDFVREFDKHVPLGAAFWIKRDEKDWQLYLASASFIEPHLPHASSELIETLHATGSPLSSLDIKIVGIEDPVVQDVIEIQRKYPTTEVRRLRTRLLGRKMVEDCYIYPLPVPQPN